MNLEDITLLSFGSFEKTILPQVAETVRHEFQNEVFIKESRIDLIEFYDPARRQYNGNLLLGKIKNMSFSENMKVIGVFNVDLFIPILTFIFGQAMLQGKFGIVSIYRLKNERYGLKEDRNLLIDRLKKEVIHELGHTYGLIHCINPKCVMRSSTYVEDIDLKQSGLCSKCKTELGLKYF